ncbi:PP2C family protein-serine/threonine phosphatase [Streptomyces sp. SPB162]|uniref:PP2C family protein-serine/threonine phosphatase n=1 Tax=Streptomyces sp. SPB162 TaxID=2940560 RepID=UPI0024057407|nr:PP2C family protein-serine/threonine phosphatase [Streptomyces sp. SPB162]MDF9812204.1 serine phosphatase RsbU (regulator of sigma subunit) [Streptomyces sp. SPB162]
MIRIRAVSGAPGLPSGLPGFLLFVLPGVWCGLVLVAASVAPGVKLLPALAVAPAIACVGSGRRQCVLASGATALVALLSEAVGRGAREAQECLGTALAVLAVVALCYRMAGRRAGMTAELERTREIAVATQRVLLRPLPPRVNGYAVAGEYLSACEGARVGGDLYEVLATPYGLRAVLGDVRGHGLTAIDSVAALLGSFREAAYDEPELTGVLARLDRSLHRHLRQRSCAEHPAVAGTESQNPVAEEFVTLLLVQLGDDGTLESVNCGHPQPYVAGPYASGERPWALALGDPLPPLGLLDDGDRAAPAHRGVLLPGQALVLYTDGLQDARNTSGTFFPLPEAVASAAADARIGGALTAAPLARALSAAALRHTAGRPVDDTALLVLLREVARVPLRLRRAALSATPNG